VNSYYRSVNGRSILSKVARQYRAAVLELVSQPQPFKGRLAVVLHVYPPDKRRRDLDNAAKGILDALQHAGVYLDDSQIDRLTIVRKTVVTHGQILVEIEDGHTGDS
jgi:crossover junction endodeoxyribonuclease RusA